MWGSNPQPLAQRSGALTIAQSNRNVLFSFNIVQRIFNIVWPLEDTLRLREGHSVSWLCLTSLYTSVLYIIAILYQDLEDVDKFNGGLKEENENSKNPFLKSRDCFFFWPLRKPTLLPKKDAWLKFQFYWDFDYETLVITREKCAQDDGANHVVHII